MENFIKSLKYVPKIWSALCYLAILGFSLLLFFGRNFKGIRIGALVNMMPGFYYHISNFSLTLMIFATVGYVGLMVGLKLKHIIFIGIVFGIVNLIFELFISILNTPDKTDAFFGMIGVFLGLIFLSAMKKKGLKKNVI
ncbi:hypothetical protein [Algoriphagus pacificus]|uniref:VanZ like family protein n=1 Tax=Algoriphagus pacificus TaxID=2811234 RepID=A0ABS3CIP6_9BACT|nr:hypothetical protein [Algoriphagus pacificus]MBN7816968.1 hypothetical protein [Algoriphagus pacificus]